MTASSSPAEELAVIPLGEERTVRLGQLIGRGQNASVYRGILSAPHRFRRALAVKVFDPAGWEDPTLLEDAIARTVRKAACVHHPNVVAPVEYARVGDRPVVLSELVEGTSLTRLQEAHARLGRRFPPDLALFIALEVAEALTGARDARTPDNATLHMRHHDLSPREILISWHGEVKVTDFGVSAALRGGTAITDFTNVARRCATMAPEVVCGGRGDGRSDVFSLGIVLRQMLVGPRFSESTSEPDMLALARDGAIPIGLMESPLHGPIEEILQRALAVDPAHRYADAGRFAFDLRRACLSMGVGDGRVFLRTAMRDLLGSEMKQPEPTQPEPAQKRAKSDSGEIVTVAGIESSRRAG
jgi:serine/threonine-protein kinase